MSKLLRKFKTHLIDELYEDISDSNNSYYVGVSRVEEWDDEDNPDLETNKLSDILDLEKELIIAVKVNASDVSYLIDRNIWESGTVYTQFDATDPDIQDKNYYVINSYNDVYKCISNNGGEASTVEPTSTITSTITLGDGYIWKYMFSVSNDANTKFTSNSYIPIVANSTVEGAATDGSLEYIQITNAGNNYVGYNTGSIKEKVTNKVYRVDSTANSIVSFYTNSSIYISSGTGAGGLVRISNSHSNSSGKYVTLEEDLSLDVTSEYIISPTIEITGDGSNAQAYSTVSNGAIDSIQIIDTGEGYTYASVITRGSESYANLASFTPLIGPKGGHGSSPKNELSSKTLGINIRIANNVSNDLPTSNMSYHQISLMYNPRYANSDIADDNVISFSSTFTVTNSEIFSIGEEVTGESSGAKGIVYHKDSDTYKLNYVRGSFTNSETVSVSSGNTATISNTINTDLDPHSMDILFYDNVEKITRANTEDEVVKFIIDLT